MTTEDSQIFTVNQVMLEDVKDDFQCECGDMDVIHEMFGWSNDQFGNGCGTEMNQLFKDWDNKLQVKEEYAKP